jgi:hypothetical protein
MTGPFRTHLFSLGALGALGLVGLSACGTVEAKQGAPAIAQASSLACDSARTELQKAVDAYTMLEQAPPPNEQALVPGYLLAPSQLMDIDAKGNVVPAPGSGCH